MVWSKFDFEREVRRQLIEIASIRKRSQENEDALERLDRLEESQLYLIRKLRETLDAYEKSGAFDELREKPARGSGKTSRGKSRADRRGRATDENQLDDLAEDGGSAGDESDHDVDGVGPLSDSLALEIDLPADVLEHIRDLALRCAAFTDAGEVAEDARGVAAAGAQTQVVVVAKAGAQAPDIRECCGTCGQLLLSGLLAGEEVVRHDEAWHHSACLDGSGRHGGSSLLN